MLNKQVQCYLELWSCLLKYQAIKRVKVESPLAPIEEKILLFPVFGTKRLKQKAGKWNPKKPEPFAPKKHQYQLKTSKYYSFFIA